MSIKDEEKKNKIKRNLINKLPEQSNHNTMCFILFFKYLFFQ